MSQIEQNLPQSLAHMFYQRVKATPEDEALRVKRQGRWQKILWREHYNEIMAIARGLYDLVQPKGIVCLLSENRPEWSATDLAILALGAVNAPIYPTNAPKDIAYIINDCKARQLFLSTPAQLQKILQLQKEEKIPSVEQIICFEEAPECDGQEILSLAQFKERGKEVQEEQILERTEAIETDDLATLIYTSGTTGEPKGVMLSHKNLLSNVSALADLLYSANVTSGQMLSFLPLSHSFERTIGHYLPIRMGIQVAYAESIDKLIDNMGEVQPTFLVSVPRIYEKLYARVMEQVSGSSFKKTLLHWGLGVAERRLEAVFAGKSAGMFTELQYKVADALLFAKIRARLGGKLEYAVSGGAPLAKDIAKFIFGIGLVVLEGYGLSETSPVLTANRPDAIRLGSVGTPITGTELKIQPEPGYDRENEGEVLARGPHIMQGYYKKEGATREVLDEEGWFHTGDIGYIDEDGFLFITDRKKELLKTSGGKYVAPQPIENRLKVHPLIEQAVVIGNKRKYCVALIVPSFESLNATLNIQTSPEELIQRPDVRELIQKAIDEVNTDLGRWEQIKKFALLPQELSQATDELTPTLKIKRRVVDEKYKSLIDELYPS